MLYDPHEQKEYERKLAATPTNTTVKPVAMRVWKLGKVAIFIGLPLMLVHMQLGLWLVFSGLVIGGVSLAEARTKPVLLDRPGAERLLPLLFLWFCASMCVLFGGVVFLNWQVALLGLAMLIGTGGLCVVLQFMAPEVPLPEPPKPMPHGNAHFATTEELIAAGIFGPADPPEGKHDD
jgi:hypothetical protein